MAASVSTPAQVFNLALVVSGVPYEVGSLYDGSEAAKTGLRIYAQVRDATLRSRVWPFARKTATLSLSGQAAPYPWTYSYTYPADCIAIRNVNSAAVQPDINDPVPTTWTIADDSTVGKVVLSNIQTASAVYTAQVTNPSQWDSLFVETMVLALAKAIANKWNKEGVKFYAQAEEETASMADAIKG